MGVGVLDGVGNAAGCEQVDDARGKIRAVVDLQEAMRGIHRCSSNSSTVRPISLAIWRSKIGDRSRPA